MTLEHLRLASSDRESLDESEPEDDGLCHRCTHALDYHRTESRRCTFEILDCLLCGSRLQAGWNDGDLARCPGCGALVDARCDCRLPLRIVE